MKKLSKKISILLILITLIISLIPINTRAITLGEYEAKVTKYQNEIAATKNAIKKTEQQISNTKNEISRINKEVENLDTEIDTLLKEVEQGKKDIKEKSLQIKEFYSYYQVSNGENLYLEYAFGADNMTDFIYRMSIVEQMTEYNKEVIKNLNDMISKNEKREVEIKKKQKDLAKKKESLNDKVKSLGEDVASLEEGGVDSEKQLKIYQEIVASYKKLGCKSKDVIGVDCAVNGPAGKFRRPTAKGRLSSGFGWRWGSFHRGVDITSSNRRREKIYPVANGTITSKYHDNYGALVVIIEHYDSDSRTWYSSLYAHLSSYAPNISTGQYITSDRYIGYMGNTGYVIPRPTASNPDAGTHLHLEVAPCRIYKDNKCGSWNRYVSFMKRSASNGYKGPKQLINLPSSWNSR